MASPNLEGFERWCVNIWGIPKILIFFFFFCPYNRLQSQTKREVTFGFRTLRRKDRQSKSELVG